MKDNVVKVISVIVGVALVFLVIRFFIIHLLTHKQTTKHEIVSNISIGDTARLRDAKDFIKQAKKADAIKILEEIVSFKRSPKETAQAFLLLADIYRGDGNFLKAKEAYITLAKEYPDYCDYASIQKNLTALNIDILFSPLQTKESEIYVVKPGDLLLKIAQKYSTTTDLIKRANRLTSDMIRPGMKLKVQKASFSIVVDKSQSTLTLISGDEVIKTYAVSTGKNNSTPTGTFKIQNKLINPPWYSPRGVLIPPDSPDNALGSRWMGFNIAKPDYGIHGTNDPQSIGYQCTEGCVRMHNQDIEELYTIVPTGTEVTIID